VRGLNVTPYLKGIATYIPGLYPYLVDWVRPGKTGGTDSARYCYSIWLRHLVAARENGLPTEPEVVAELGPGDSLGTGAAALLCGAETYYALDVVKYATNERNLQMVDELAELFQERAPIPDPSEFPEALPPLARYDFPAHILSGARMKRMLAPARIESIKRAFAKPHSRNSIQVQYHVPWDDVSVIQTGAVDMIVAQAVMEHVRDPEGTYRSLSQWLKPTGYLSQTIDFRSHGTAEQWNGHWSYSDCEWKLVQGRRPYLLNRQPHSVHLELLTRCGFKIVCDRPFKGKHGLQRGQLAKRFRRLSEDDLTIASTFIQALPPQQIASSEPSQLPDKP
jgi:hypothetical protein